jgi:hypothetical protein
MRLISKGLLVVGPEGLGIIVPILIHILWWWVSGNEDVGVFVVVVIAGLELALHCRTWASVLSWLIGDVPQLQSSQMHLDSWLT